QIQGLHKTFELKKTSSRYKKFIERFGAGATAHEVDSLDPDVLQHLLREAIDSVMDIEAYNREIELEAKEAPMLQAARQRALDAVGDFAGQDYDPDEEEDDEDDDEN